MVDAGASPRMYAPILDSTGMNRDRVGATRVEGDRPSSLASLRSILRRAAGDLGEARAPYRVVGDLDGELDGDPDGDPGGRENLCGLRAGDENLGELCVGELRAGELRVSALVVLTPGLGLGLASGLFFSGLRSTDVATDHGSAVERLAALAANSVEDLAEADADDRATEERTLTLALALAPPPPPPPAAFIDRRVSRRGVFAADGARVDGSESTALSRSYSRDRRSVSALAR